MASPDHEEKQDDLSSPTDTASLSSNPTRTRASHNNTVTRTTTHRSYVDAHGYYHADTHAQESRAKREDDGDKAFEVGWDGLDDPMSPKNLPEFKKWLIVITLCLGSLCVTCTSSLYTSTYEGMDAEFGNSRIVATLGLTLFVFGLGLSPMLLGPLSEFYGRRPIYVFGLLFFTIWLIPCAVAQNIQTELIARFIDGFSGSAFLSVAGGTVGDMFTKETLTAPMIVYTASPFLGPAIGPVIGGFINYNTSWRWSYYVLIIWSSIMLVAVALFVPETYNPVCLRNKAKRMRAKTGDPRWKAPMEMTGKSVVATVGHSLYRPFMLLFLDPMCFSLCLFTAILLGILYLFFGAFELVFSQVYGFDLWQVGLTFCGLLVGMSLAIASDPIWHYNYLRLLNNVEKRTGERKSEPEFRLPPAIVGSWFVVCGLIWFAWTIYASIHWIVPIIATGFFGFGIILVFSGVFTFLVEAFPLYAASALSANSFARSSFAGAFPLFGDQMYNTLNFHWATTLLALLCLVMAPFPYIFFIYGKRLRQKSRFGST